MTTYTVTAAWIDAAERGTPLERALIAAGRLLTHAGARSARRRAERRDQVPSASERQRDDTRTGAVVWGVLRR